MRILKEIDRAGMKISFFSYQNKITVKFEKDLVEIIYKFRDGSGVDSVEDAESFLDDSFLADMHQSLTYLSEKRYNRWQLWHNNGHKGQEIEVII